MAASLTALQFPSPYLQTHNTPTTKFKLKSTPIPKLNGFSRIKCSYSNGRKPDSGDEMTREERRRAELSARIASGEFTVEKPSLGSLLVSSLAKLGVPSDFLEPLANLINSGENYPKIPEAKGAISAIRSEAFFIPLYELYLTYGGIFRLTFGPKSFLIVSDPNIAKHILRDNAKAYSKGILAEILEFVMGTGLIPADGEVWRVRRRVIVPALHLKYVAAMIGLFGEATDRLCKKLDASAYNGEDVEMESLFSRLTLDIIGKSVFNYDFDSLTTDNGIVEAVYTVLREAEDRSVSPIPTWEIPIWKDVSPRQRKVNEALKLINTTLDDLIAICKRMVDEEDVQFNEEYMNESDPSILHFLLASGDNFVTPFPLMDSQDQGMSFTTLLSEDHQFGPTYVGQSGTSQETFDDSLPLPLNNPIIVKKTARGSNFSPEEDKLLVSAWLNCSLDAVQGTDQKHSQFWEKVFEYFQQYKDTTTERTLKSLTIRWSFIQKATNKFCSTLAQVEGLNQSGMTEHDKLEKAKIMYHSLEKCNFQFEHCWHLLKDQPKWISRGTKEATKQRRTSLTPTTTRCPVPIDDSVLNLETGNVIETDVIELDRPIGRKSEKRKRKAQAMQAEEIIQIRKLKYTLLEESRAQEKEYYRLKAEKMEYDKEKEEKWLQLEIEKIEIAKKESDQRIMMMDLSIMTEMQRQYFEELQMEIMRRRNHG